MVTYTPKTEGQHKGEHIVSLFNGAPSNGGDISLENGVYASGHGKIIDGTVVKLVANKLVPVVGTVDTAAESDEAVVGTAYGNFDTTSGDVKGAYVARLAVLHSPLVIVPAGSRAAVLAALAKLFIIVR